MANRHYAQRIPAEPAAEDCQEKIPGHILPTRIVSGVLRVQWTDRVRHQLFYGCYVLPKVYTDIVLCRCKEQEHYRRESKQNSANAGIAECGRERLARHKQRPRMPAQRRGH